MAWSYSSFRELRTCQRKFAFGNIVASAVAKDVERREAYILKQVQRLSEWRGSLVHHILATAFLQDLRTGRPADPAALTAATYDLARRQFEFSAARRYREPGMTKSAAGDAYCALYVHEYGVDVSEDELAALYADMAQCFTNLAAQDEFLAYIYSGSDFHAEPILHFRLDDRAVMAKLDLLFFNLEGRPVIIDWKIGESDTGYHAPQLFIYALAAERCGRWSGLAADSVELYEANLLRGEIRCHPNSRERVDEAEDLVYEGLVEEERVFGSNSFKDLDLSDLPVAEKPTTCAFCSFASPCLRNLAQAARSCDLVAVQGRLL